MKKVKFYFFVGVAPQEVVAIGDNHNDIGMIRFTGLGVAMPMMRSRRKQIM